MEPKLLFCPDSLVCGMSSKLATAWGLVIDRSASMEEPISQTDLFTTRMAAMKTALKNNLFLLILSRRDYIFIEKMSQDFTIRF